LVKWFQEELGMENVFVSNSIPTLATQLVHSSKFFESPQIYNNKYIPKLLKFCVENEITHLISLYDIDLPVLAKNKSEFKKIGVTVLLPDLEKIEICNDKWKMGEFCRNINLDTPLTYKTIFDAEVAIKQGFLKFPVVIKPRFGNGSQGIYFANDFKELHELSSLSANDVKNSALKFESKDSIGEEILFQEKLEGKEKDTIIVSDFSGHYIGSWGIERITQRAGETDIGKTVTS
jgi:carbamoyl-phosphate synthase large subunit